MANQSGSVVAAWIGILVAGLCLNSVGLVLSDGLFRWILMGCGLILVIVAFLGLVRQAKQKQ